MRKLDLLQLKLWAKRFKSQSDATSFLNMKTGIGFYSLRRVLQGKREPSQSEQLALTQATGLDADTLFPVCETGEEKTA